MALLIVHSNLCTSNMHVTKCLLNSCLMTSYKSCSSHDPTTSHDLTCSSHGITWSHMTSHDLTWHHMISHSLLFFQSQRRTLRIVHTEQGIGFCPYRQSPVTSALWTSKQCIACRVHRDKLPLMNCCMQWMLMMCRTKRKWFHGTKKNGIQLEFKPNIFCPLQSDA